MDNIEIIEVDSSRSVGSSTLEDKAISLQSQVVNAMSTLASAGLSDSIDFNGGQVVIEAQNFVDIVKVFAAGQSALLSEKDSHITDLRDSIQVYKDNYQGSKDIKDLVNKNDSILDKKMNSILDKLDTMTFEELGNDNSDKQVDSSDIINSLIDIIRVQNEKFDSLEKDIKDTKISVIGLTDCMSDALKSIEKDRKILAIKYLMQNRTELEKETGVKSKRGRNKKISDDLLKELYSQTNGNISHMVSLAQQNYKINISWQAIDKRVKELGLKARIRV